MPFHKRILYLSIKWDFDVYLSPKRCLKIFWRNNAITDTVKIVTSEHSLTSFWRQTLKSHDTLAQYYRGNHYWGNHLTILTLFIHTYSIIGVSQQIYCHFQHKWHLILTCNSLKLFKIHSIQIVPNIGFQFIHYKLSLWKHCVYGCSTSCSDLPDLQIW